jgi:hypothetical protein
MSGAPNDFPSLKPGGHVCLPYAKEEEKQAPSPDSFTTVSLRGERCIYWGHAAGFAALLPTSNRPGVQLSTLRDRGTLVFADATPGPLALAFDANVQSLSAHRASRASARSEGYTGLRVAGDPDAKDRSGGIDREQLASFENSAVPTLR